MKWYPEPDLNRHAFRRGILNPLCLPIPPPGQNGGGYQNRTGVHGFAIRCITTLPTRHFANPSFYQHELSDFIYGINLTTGKSFVLTTNYIGAANETRTRDIHVGNVMLYQLSYSRFIHIVVLKHPVRLLFPVASFADSLSTKTHSTSYCVTVNY